MRRFSVNKVCQVILPVMFFVTTGFAASASVEVLYVATTQGSNASLITYNVNPATAVATQVGNPITVGASNIDPVTVGNQHLIYVWDSGNDWLFNTNAQGVPQNQPLQHLTFKFAH